MPCHRPLKAFSLTSGGLSFVEKGDVKGDVKIPCGQCLGCRLDRVRDWSLRIGHESRLHATNYFLTLTYDDQHLPMPPSLNYGHIQTLNKALRKAFGPFRFFCVGEYGELTRRPHYHMITFGLQLPDLRRYGGRDEMPTFESPRLNSLWGKGFCLIGGVTPQSAAYCAKYSLKKVNGDQAQSHYRWVSADGEVFQLEPEFARMSTRPGIGAAWYEQFHADVHTHDYVIRDGAKNPVPRYYDKLARTKGYDLDEIKQAREIKSLPNKWNQTDERLAVRAEVALAKSNLSKRPL